MLSDPNIDPHYLGMLVMVGANKKRFAPSVQAIKERYYKKFRGKSGFRCWISVGFKSRSVWRPRGRQQQAPRPP